MNTVNRKLSRPDDTTWYQVFRPLPLRQPHHYFDESKDTRSKQKKYFLEQKIPVPHLDRPLVFSQDLAATMRPLQAFLAQINQSKTVSLQYSLYQRRIRELIDGFKLVQASKDNDWNGWQLLNEKLYGPIDRDIFWGVYGYFQRQAEQVQAHSDTTEAQISAADYFLSKVSADVNIPWYRPQEEIFMALRRQVQADLAQLESIVQPQTMFNADEVCLVFEKVFKAFGIDDVWEVKKNQTPTQATLRVNRQNRQMIIPAHFTCNRKKLLAILVHEVGISPRFAGHILRSHNGQQTNFKLLAAGLDHYNIGEEGICILWEQLTLGEYAQDRKMLLYFLLGMITGVDGTKRGFAEIFTLVQSYYQWKFPQLSIEEQNSRAYEVCMRLFRGTDTQQTGIAFMKDKIYYEGNVRLWQLLEKNPQLIHNLSIGSFNPLSAEHWKLVQTLIA